MKKPLNPKISYSFEDQEELSDFIIDMNTKILKKKKTIKIIKFKRKTLDTSTKLF